MAREFVPTSRLEYADNACFDYTSDFTAALWFYPYGSGGDRELIRKAFNYIIRTSGSDLLLIWWNGSGALRGFLTSVTPLLNQWNQAVFTVSADEPQSMYVNGTDLGLSVTNFGGGTRALTDNFFIGGSASGEAFDGRLAEIGLWNSVLTSGNVTSLQTQKPNTVGSPMAYIPLDADTDEKIVGITPSVTGTINTVSHPPALSGGGGTANPWYYYAQQ